MLVEIENVKYYDEKVGCETRNIEKEIKISPTEIQIDGKEHNVTFVLKDMKDSDTECEIRMIASDKDLDISVESGIMDTQGILLDMYRSITCNDEIEESDLFVETKKELISKLYKDISKEKLIEKVFYDNIVILQSGDTKIGTATGFSFFDNVLTLEFLDLISEMNCDNEIVAKSFIDNNKGVEFTVKYLSEDDFEIVDVKITEEEVDEVFLNQKRFSDFGNAEEYAEYRRSLIVDDLSQSLYEDFDFDDIF